MIFESYLPCPPLREYVEAIHLRHFEFPVGTVPPFKPYHCRPEQWLSFCVRDPEILEYVSEHKMIERPGPLITGQHTCRVNRHLGGTDFLILIVNFQPGALYRFSRIPADELNDSGIHAEALFSSELNHVNSRLNSTDDYAEMIKIVEDFLIRRLARLKVDLHVVDLLAKEIIRSPEYPSLNKLASFANLSARQFERKFIERTGIGVKQFIRMARFDKACKLKYMHPGDDWLGIALACGYHDYQHLVRDSKEFSNSTPVEYFFQDGSANGAIPIDTWKLLL